MFRFITALLMAFTFAAAAELADVKIIKKATPFLGSIMYVPNDGQTHPGIVFLHGSEGGSLPYNQLEAEFLAAHGYTVLAFCWYNCLKNSITGPYEPLENVELRSSINAIAWLKKSPEVNGKKVALLGVSRGGEQAVLLGSIEDAGRLLDAIAVHTPSDTIVGGFNWSWMDKRCWICKTGDLACFKSSNNSQDWDYRNMTWNPACGTEPNASSWDIDAWLFDGKSLPVGKPIEIEKFNKPVFITVGDKDDIWPYEKSVRLADRLNAFKRPVEFHLFPGELHRFSIKAENERHALLLKFLSQNL